MPTAIQPNSVRLQHPFPLDPVRFRKLQQKYIRDRDALPSPLKQELGYEDCLNKIEADRKAFTERRAGPVIRFAGYRETCSRARLEDLSLSMRDCSGVNA